MANYPRPVLFDIPGAVQQGIQDARQNTLQRLAIDERRDQMANRQNQDALQNTLQRLAIGERRDQMANRQNIDLTLKQAATSQDRMRIINRLASYGDAGLNTASRLQGLWQAQDKVLMDRKKQYAASGYQVISQLPHDQRQAAWSEWIQQGQANGMDMGKTPQEYSDNALLALQYLGGDLTRNIDEPADPADVGAFKYFTKGMSGEDTMQAKRVKLGLEPRATGAASKSVMIGDVPYVFDPKTGGYLPGQIGDKTITAQDVAENKTTVKGAEAEAAASGKGIGESNMAQYDTVNAAASNIKQIDDLIDHIENSEAITGLGAELIKNIERAKTLFGSDVASGKVADTEILDTMMGSEVFPMIKSLGIGARGMDTPAEREFMRKVLTGSIELNKTTLLQMAETRRAIAERAIKKWKERSEKGELDRFYQATGLSKDSIRLPSPRIGTIEDGHKYLGGDPSDPKNWKKQ